MRQADLFFLKSFGELRATLSAPAIVYIRLFVSHLQLRDGLASRLHEVAIQVVARVDKAASGELVRVDCSSLILCHFCYRNCNLRVRICGWSRDGQADS